MSFWFLLATPGRHCRLCKIFNSPSADFRILVNLESLNLMNLVPVANPLMTLERVKRDWFIWAPSDSVSLDFSLPVKSTRFWISRGKKGLGERNSLKERIHKGYKSIASNLKYKKFPLQVSLESINVYPEKFCGVNFVTNLMLVLPNLAS